MRLLNYRPVILMFILAAPAGAVAAAPPGIAHPASVAAVLLWLAGLGWGFHAMLRHRLAAEDRLAQLETDVVFERDARAAQISATRQGMQLLADEWQRLEACLTEGDVRHVTLHMHAVHACIAQLQQST
ncbi:hypothetical protein [Massilia sp. S19_KUP03_FR1]|uniref:hypothetical protein n=1 Tax=Massilia sp. S19_KUP03_FR1 TaxID=3025503 RepID=UPI002FCDDB2D